MTSSYEKFLALNTNEQRSNPYVISEIGVNHEGSLTKALELIDQSVDAGAHCVKFQTYKADKLAAKDSPAYWDTSQEPTESQFKLFSKFDSFNFEDYELLHQHAQVRGVDFLTTPFDQESVEALDHILPFYKVASADLTNKPLLRSIARMGKPIIISTGASTLDEVIRSVDFLRCEGAHSIALLHCILRYPTDDQYASLEGINTLALAFPDLLVGYSDHVRSDEALDVLKIANSLGAVILEKHFTDDKTKSGNDHYHAMDYEDLKSFTGFVERRRILVGDSNRDLENERMAIQNARRGVYVTRDLKRGDVIQEEDIIPKRPPTEIDIWSWDELVGKELTQDFYEGDALSPKGFK